MSGVEIVLNRVIVGRCGYHHILGFAICRCAIESGGEIKFFFGKIFFDILVLDGRAAIVYLVDLFRDDIYCGYMMVLGSRVAMLSPT